MNATINQKRATLAADNAVLEILPLPELGITQVPRLKTVSHCHNNCVLTEVTWGLPLHIAGAL
jgi:hypothetical protein